MEDRCLPGQCDEHVLGDILRARKIPPHLAQGGGMNKVEMPSHQFAERFGGFLVGVLAKQRGIVLHHLSHTCRRRQKPTENLAPGAPDPDPPPSWAGAMPGGSEAARRCGH
jgi:hypothetical protein